MMLMKMTNVYLNRAVTKMLGWPLLCVIVCFSACSKLNKTAKPTGPSAQEAWQNTVIHAANNEERLHRMLQGTYVRYSYKNPKTKGYRAWRVNDGQDSVIYYVKSIGDPNKDGYCLLHCLFMTHLPDRPLTTHISKIQQITRDSLVLRNYSSMKTTLAAVLDGTVEKEIELSKFDSENAATICSYIKESNERFRLIKPRKKYGIGNDPKRVSYQSFGHVDFMVHHEDAVFYDKDGEETSVAFNHDKRLFDFDFQAVLEREE